MSLGVLVMKWRSLLLVSPPPQQLLETKQKAGGLNTYLWSHYGCTSSCARKTVRFSHPSSLCSSPPFFLLPLLTPHILGPELDQHQVLFLRHSLSLNLVLNGLTTLTASKPQRCTFLHFLSTRIIGSNSNPYLLYKCCQYKLESLCLHCKHFYQLSHLACPGLTFWRNLEQWLSKFVLSMESVTCLY